MHFKKQKKEYVGTSKQSRDIPKVLRNVIFLSLNTGLKRYKYLYT